jgi:hypothetical protein
MGYGLWAMGGTRLCTGLWSMDFVGYELPGHGL